MVKLPHLSNLKAAANLLRKEALLAAEGLRPDTTAAASISVGLGLGRTVKTEPVVISQLVYLAMNQIALDTLERALNRTAFTEVELTNLMAALAEADDPTGFGQTLAGERANAIPYFRMTRADAARVAEPGADSPLPPSGALGAMGFTGFFERDLLFYLGAMETNITLLNLGAPRSLQVTNVNNVLCLEARRKLCIAI